MTAEYACDAIGLVETSQSTPVGRTGWAAAVAVVSGAAGGCGVVLVHHESDEDEPLELPFSAQNVTASGTRSLLIELCGVAEVESVSVLLRFDPPSARDAVRAQWD